MAEVLLQMQTSMGSIKHKMNDFANSFLEWTNKESKEIEAKEVFYKKSLAEDEEIIRALSNREKAAQVQRTKLNQELQKEVQEETTKKSEINQLRTKERECPDSVSKSRECVTLLKEELDTEKAKLEDKEKAFNYVVGELTHGLAFFKQRLGLEFVRIGAGRLRLVFKYIDAEKPEREFFFSVHVNEKDQYLIEECNPVLPASELRVLLDELNNTNNFGKFVGAMRKKFKATLQRP